MQKLFWEDQKLEPYHAKAQKSGNTKNAKKTILGINQNQILIRKWLLKIMIFFAAYYLDFASWRESFPAIPFAQTAQRRNCRETRKEHFTQRRKRSQEQGRKEVQSQIMGRSKASLKCAHATPFAQTAQGRTYREAQKITRTRTQRSAKPFYGKIKS